MPDDIDDRVTRPWFWPGDWVRDEKFWRDIGTRVLAGVITAAIVYLGALVLGYLHTPEVGAGLLLVGGVVVAALVLLAVVALVRALAGRSRH